MNAIYRIHQLQKHIVVESRYISTEGKNPQKVIRDKCTRSSGTKGGVGKTFVSINLAVPQPTFSGNVLF